VNEVIAKAKERHVEAMKGLAEGVDLPGLNQMLAQFTGSDPGGGDPFRGSGGA
jgi:hypothetical protein